MNLQELVICAGIVCIAVIGRPGTCPGLHLPVEGGISHPHLPGGGWLHAINYYITDYTSGEFLDIEPETIGKAIGKQDIAGRMIFSGDIVKFFNNASQPDDYITCVIEWEAEKFRWCIYAIEEKKRFFISPTGKYEVIGNVVDNPNLIKITV